MVASLHPATHSLTCFSSFAASCKGGMPWHVTQATYLPCLCHVLLSCRETLPMHAMDTAIRLHHTLIRKLLAEHRGYESATEGDAFIMGFHTASQAMHFACDLQQQLMTQPWPEQVLSFHVSAPVWAKVGQKGAHSCSASFTSLCF